MNQELAISNQPGPSAADVSQRIIEPRNLMEYSRRTFFRDDNCADLVLDYERQVQPAAVETQRLAAPAPWPHRPKEIIVNDYAEYFTDERCEEIAQRIRAGESFSSVCHSYTASAPTVKRYLEKAGYNPLTGQKVEDEDMSQLGNQNYANRWDEHFTAVHVSLLAAKIRRGATFTAVAQDEPASITTVQKYMNKFGYDHLTGERLPDAPATPERSHANSEETAVSVAEPEMVEETAVSVADGKTAVDVADGLDRLVSLRRLVQELQAAGVDVAINGRISINIEF